MVRPASGGISDMKTRPSLDTAEIAEYILDQLRKGRSLQEICRDDDMPHRDTVTKWIEQDREGLAARYRQAREIVIHIPGRRGYSAETAERFLGEVMIGRTLVEVCGDPGMPDHTTINRWVATNREGFAERYRSARQIGRLARAAIPYTPDIADLVLEGLMSGRPLADICDEPDMPSATSVRHWLNNNRDGFTARYWQAREIGFHAIGDQILQIVDDRRNDWIVLCREDGTLEAILDPERVNRAALRLKARTWLLPRMLPKTFGNRPDFFARPETDGDYKRDLAEMMKLIDGRTRGLPSEDEPLDDA
jgi:hypothetical protein